MNKAFVLLAALSLSACHHKIDDGGGWRSMWDAPRDGTPIEIKNNYGVMPTYSLDKFATSITTGVCQNTSPCAHPVDTVQIQMPGGIWLTVAPKAYAQGYFDQKDDANYQWRPYHGAIKDYVDPTHGAQDTADYWNHPDEWKVGP